MTIPGNRRFGGRFGFHRIKILNKKDEHLSAETRERVLKLVREYHYSPYSGVRAAVQAQTMLLGVAVNRNRPHGRLGFHREIMPQNGGYSCGDGFRHAGGGAAESERPQVSSRGRDPLGQAGPVPSCLQRGAGGDPRAENGLLRAPSPENSCIDYAGLAYQAAAYLIAQKHRNILCVIPQVSGYSEQAFVQGYRQCLFEHQVPFSPDRVCVCGKAGACEGSAVGKYRRTLFLIQSWPAGFEACSRKNRRIPKYLSVLSLSDGEKSPFFQSCPYPPAL